jgi:hypothetical protein
MSNFQRENAIQKDLNQYERRRPIHIQARSQPRSNGGLHVIELIRTHLWSDGVMGRIDSLSDQQRGVVGSGIFEVWRPCDALQFFTVCHRISEVTISNAVGTNRDATEFQAHYFPLKPPWVIVEVNLVDLVFFISTFYFILLIFYLFGIWVRDSFDF